MNIRFHFHLLCVAFMFTMFRSNWFLSWSMLLSLVYLQNSVFLFPTTLSWIDRLSLSRKCLENWHWKLFCLKKATLRVSLVCPVRKRSVLDSLSRDHPKFFVVVYTFDFWFQCFVTEIPSRVIQRYFFFVSSAYVECTDGVWTRARVPKYCNDSSTYGKP